MSDPMRPNTNHDTAAPPGGGWQDHETMRAAAQRPVSGPASTDQLAAIGGLSLPGGEAHPELPAAGGDLAHGGAPSPSASAEPVAPGGQAPHEPIPGERDATTLTHREPGAVSGQFAGADIPVATPGGWMDDQTAYEHAKEGGGDTARRKKS